MTDQDRAIDHEHALISSRRVEGTPVFNPKGEKLGTILSVMLEKNSGKAAYAMMSFGGFLKMKEQVHPIPWEMLNYDVDRDGYCVDLDRDTLVNAPRMELDEADRPRDRAYDEDVSRYYGTMRWWGF